MSTRDEILDVLGKHPDGLTSKEIAPHCPAAECDLMLVGRMVGALGLSAGVERAVFGAQLLGGVARHPKGFFVVHSLCPRRIR